MGWGWPAGQAPHLLQVLLGALVVVQGGLALEVLLAGHAVPHQLLLSRQVLRGSSGRCSTQLRERRSCGQVALHPTNVSCPTRFAPLGQKRGSGAERAQGEGTNWDWQVPAAQTGTRKFQAARRMQALTHMACHLWVSA